MSFQLVKESVLNIRCDAVLNFVSPAELADHKFSSSELVEQAGPGLVNHFSDWEDLRRNHPVVTGAYKLPHCYYIVHTLGVDHSGSALEQISSVQSSLEAALALSRKCGFQSIAIPLLYFSEENPEYSFYRVFVRIIQGFLATLNDKNEMTVYLSVPGNVIDRVPNPLHDSVSQYIEENYIDIDIDDTSFYMPSYEKAKACISDEVLQTPSMAKIEDLDVWGDENDELASDEEEVEKHAFIGAADYSVAFTPSVFAEKKKKPDSFKDQDKSFIEMVDWWIEKKGISMKTFYLQSNLNRAMLSNLRCHPGQLPKKSNALACAVGLKLTMEEAEDLIGRAGFSFSKYVKSDVIVEYFIEKGIYDIFLINEELFAQDLSLLGTS